MNAEEGLALKRTLLDACLAKQEKFVKDSHEAMLEAQATANEQKGSMGDKYESFREQMQIDRDMYARQYDEGLQVLQVIKRIDAEKVQKSAALGAVVITGSKKFFVSASLGTIKAGEDTFVAISTQSPMFQSMAGKKAGDDFSFRDMKFRIVEVW